MYPTSLYISYFHFSNKNITKLVPVIYLSLPSQKKQTENGNSLPGALSQAKIPRANFPSNYRYGTLPCCLQCTRLSSYGLPGLVTQFRQRECRREEEMHYDPHQVAQKGGQDLHLTPGNKRRSILSPLSLCTSFINHFGNCLIRISALYTKILWLMI